jgi:hypothetical protein
MDTAVAAGRQLLLHILPGDSGFGSPWPTPPHPVFHRVQRPIAASAILLITTTWLDDGKARGPMTMATAAAFVFVVAANLISVVAEAGLHWSLTADPNGYLMR